MCVGIRDTPTEPLGAGVGENHGRGMCVRQTFLQGMTGIKAEGKGVCVQNGGRGWGRGGVCLSWWTVHTAAPQIQLIPSGCIHLSLTSDETHTHAKPDPKGTVFSVYQFTAYSTRDIGNYFHPPLSVRREGSSPAGL